MPMNAASFVGASVASTSISDHNANAVASANAMGLKNAGQIASSNEDDLA